MNAIAWIGLANVIVLGISTAQLYLCWKVVNHLYEYYLLLRDEREAYYATKDGK